MSHRTFNKTAMSDYAIKHALNRNSNYREYTNDCTNFMSQAVRAGGWWMVNSDYDQGDDRRWNYGMFTWTTSYTWAGAHNFYKFGAWSTRTQTIGKTSLRWGDVVHIKFSGADRIGHSMMVTGRDEYDSYLSYHTNDTLMRSLASIQRQYPTSTNTYYYRHT